MGLASPGRSDHEHQTVVIGDRIGCRVLRIVSRSDGSNVGGRPGLEVLFLGEHRRGREASIGDRLGDRSSIKTSTGSAIRLGSERDAPLLGESGEPVDLRDQLGSATSVVGGKERGEVAGEVGLQPRRRLLLSQHQGLFDQRLVRDPSPTRGSATDLVRGEPGGIEAGSLGFRSPMDVQLAGVDAMDLLRPRVDHRGTFESGDRPRVRLCAVVVVGPGPDQLGQFRLHLGRASGERLPHRRRYAGEVEHTIVAVDPVDAEPGGQLGAQCGVVDPADRSLLVLQEPGI